jgi:hypothetical protein
MLNTTAKNMTFIAAVVMLGSALAIAQEGAPQATLQPVVEQSLTGTVTCSGRITHRYTCQRNQTLQTCTLACVQQGSDFVLMVGDKPYTLAGDRRSLERFAGGKATVLGLVSSDRIQVQTLADAKHKAADTHIGEQ